MKGCFTFCSSLPSIIHCVEPARRVYTVLNSQKDGDIEKFMTQNKKKNKTHRFLSRKSRSFTPQMAGKFKEERDIIPTIL